jgi:hypothetical protein
VTWRLYAAKYGRLSPLVRGAERFARIATYLQHANAGTGMYGKTPEFAKPSDFAPWLEAPIDLETAKKEWH